MIIAKFCVSDWDIEEANKSYKNLVSTFPTDYDKENPLTKKEGNKRWLEMQIAEAEASGDTEKVAALKGEVEKND